MVSPFDGLLAESEAVAGSRGAAVVAEAEHHADAPCGREVEVFVKVREEGGPLVAPHLELNEGADRVESGAAGEIELSPDLREDFGVAVRLPHRDAVHAVGGIAVESENPRLRVVPGARLGGGPLSGGRHGRFGSGHSAVSFSSSHSRRRRATSWSTFSIARPARFQMSATSSSVMPGLTRSA